MRSAEYPENETSRLKALLDYKILDTAPEEDFDDLTWLASHICQTPIALISFVDTHRQWFKSKVGLQAQETHRDIAFCAHAILEKEIFIVSDTLTDDRFADNPLVTADPCIRFYAGAQLKSANGFNLGTLCVIDRQSRQLSADQEKALRALSRQVTIQMEFRRLLYEQDHRIQQARESIEDHSLLSGLLPICAQCRNIRDTNGIWKSLESYLRAHSEAWLNHGLCPACAVKFRVQREQ